MLLWRRQAEKNWGCVFVGGGGVLSVSLETVWRPLHLQCTIRDELQEAGGQEVQDKHPPFNKKVQ